MTVRIRGLMLFTSLMTAMAESKDMVTAVDPTISGLKEAKSAASFSLVYG